MTLSIHHQTLLAAMRHGSCQSNKITWEQLRIKQDTFSVLVQIGRVRWSPEGPTSHLAIGMTHEQQTQHSQQVHILASMQPYWEPLLCTCVQLCSCSAGHIDLLL